MYHTYVPFNCLGDFDYHPNMSRDAHKKKGTLTKSESYFGHAWDVIIVTLLSLQLKNSDSIVIIRRKYSHP